MLFVAFQQLDGRSEGGLGGHVHCPHHRGDPGEWGVTRGYTRHPYPHQGHCINTQCLGVGFVLLQDNVTSV